MKRLGEFLKKHTDRLGEKSNQTIFIQEVFKKHKIPLVSKNISYRNKTLFINTTAIQKAEIVSQKEELLKELSSEMKDIQEIR